MMDKLKLYLLFHPMKCRGLVPIDIRACVCACVCVCVFLFAFLNLKVKERDYPKLFSKSMMN